jgi:hypothetical protein
MDISKLSQGERIVLVAGVLLIIDLLFLPWHSIDLGGLNVPGVDLTRSGVQSPNGGYGVVALLLAIVMVAQIVATKLASASLPSPPVPWSQVHFIAGIAVAALLVLKLVVETESLGVGSYRGILLGLAVAYGG